MEKTVKEEKVQIYTKAVELLDQEGFESSVYEEYSGRGMYSKTTPGIVSSAAGTVVGWAVMTAIDELVTQGELEESGPFDNIDKYIPTRTDNMGLDMIYY